MKRILKRTIIRYVLVVICIILLLSTFGFGDGYLSLDAITGERNGTKFLRDDLTWQTITAGSAVWGSITGTLSSQTDLNNALGGKEATITAGEIGQYWRGDKTWQTLPVSSHDRQHSITSTADHTSTATQGYLLKADANGLPIQATNTDGQVSGAVTAAHSHSNLTTLDAIQEALTTSLKTSYDWLVTNITSAWKTTVDSHIVSTSNPHSVTKAQVGLTNVTDEAQIAKSLIDAKGDVITATADNTPARLASSAVNNNVLTVDTTTATGLKWAAPAGGNDPRISIDAVNGGEQHDVTASVALTNVAVIDIPLTAGTYTFRYDVIYRSNQLTNGIRLAVNYTGTNGAFVWNWRGNDLGALASAAAADQDSVLATGAIIYSFASRAKSTTTRGVTASVDTINADLYAVIEGVFIATGAGDLELWHGSELATALYTTSVMPGTSVVVTKTK